jgi:sugar O-acyltransferase (sialic acid O-acetyltransferase NeuD family)
MKKVALIGYSDHALVVADILEQSGFKIVGYFEKEIKISNPLKLSYLGYEMDIDFDSIVKNISVFPAVGENFVRKRILENILKKKVQLADAISSHSIISKYTSIGKGTLVCAGVCLSPYSIIGDGVILNTGSIIEHGCKINNFAHIGPGAVLARNVHIGELTFIGANSVVKQGVGIGENVIVGAGSVVLKDIPNNEIWVGNPANKLLK